MKINMTRTIIEIVVIAACLAVITGCLPEEPAIPDGALCTPDGFLMAPPEITSSDATLNVSTGELTFDLDFVYNETDGGAMTCEFTY